VAIAAFVFFLGLHCILLDIVHDDLDAHTQERLCFSVRASVGPTIERVRYSG
jgi:hypothetical protein